MQGTPPGVLTSPFDSGKATRDHEDIVTEVKRLEASIASRKQILDGIRLEIEAGKSGLKRAEQGVKDTQRQAGVERAKWMTNKCEDGNLWEQDIELFVAHKGRDHGLSSADRNLGMRRCARSFV